MVDSSDIEVLSIDELRARFRTAALYLAELQLPSETRQALNVALCIAIFMAVEAPEALQIAIMEVNARILAARKPN